MNETSTTTALLGQRWMQGPIAAELMPHPEDERQLLLQVSLAGMGLDLDDLEPGRLAQALRWILRLNADVWAGQGFVLGLDDDDGLVLVQPVKLTDLQTTEQLDRVVQEGLSRGLEVAELWLQLLQAEVNEPA